MPQHYDIRLTGTLTCQTPVAVSPIGADAPQPFEPPPGLSNYKDVQFLPRCFVYKDGQPVQVPYIPGSSIRGKLRRAAADAVLASCYASDNVQVDFQTMLLLRVGGVKTSAKEDISPVLRARVIEANPALSLFGAGTSAAGFVGSRLSVSPAIPKEEIETNLITGARVAENKNPELMRLLDDDEQASIEAFTKANTERSRAKKKAQVAGRLLRKLEQEVTRGQRDANDKELLEARETKSQDYEALDAAEEAAQAAGSDVSIGMPLPGYEVLPQGLVLDHGFTLRAVTRVEAGLFVEGLEIFAADPVVGAHIAHGCGEISGNYEVVVREVGSRTWQPAGTVSFAPLTGLRLESELLDEFLAAWRDANLDPDALRAQPKLDGVEIASDDAA